MSDLNLQYPLDLFVQFITVGDHYHTGMRIVFQNPFCQQYHDDALP